MNSAIFTARQLYALTRIGDLLIPKNGDFPAFSQTGALEHIDAMMQPAHPQDIKDFKTVLSILSYLPDAVLRFILRRCANAYGKTDIFSVPLRQLDIGLRGAVYSLYYANLHGAAVQESPVFDLVGYHVHCEPD